MKNKTIESFIKTNTPYIAITLLFSLLYVFPIINAQVYYIDDLGRILTGKDWSHDVRALAGIIHKAFTFNNEIVSFYPYSIILSACIFVFTLYTLGLKVLNLSKSNSAITATLSLCSPFFLENLTYRYDSLPMTLSLIVPLLPFFIISRKKHFALSSVVAIFTSLSLFQVGSLSYFSFFIIYLFNVISIRKSAQLKEVILLSALCLFSYLIGYLLYKEIHLFLGYSFPERGEIILNTNNITIYYDRLEIFYNSLLGGLNDKIIYILVSFLLILAITSLKSKDFSLKSHILFTALLFILIFIVSLPNLLIKEPWWNSRTKINFVFVLYFYLQER